MKLRIIAALCAGSLLASQASAHTERQPTAAPSSEAEAAYQVMARAAAEARPPVWPDDRPARVRTLFRSDYDERRFFNRPAATRAQFDGEWEECRQIARRLATSGGNGYSPGASTYYPSSVAGAIGGALGGALVGMFEGAFSERRAAESIRRHCLMARGWRMVEPDEAHRRRINEMSRAERNAYLDRMLGAAQVEDARIVDFDATLAADEAATEKPARTE